MTNKTTKLVLWTLITSSLLLGNLQANAVNDNDLRKFLISEIQKEEQLSKEELKEVEKDVSQISSSDILKALKEDLNELEDKKLKKELLEKISNLDNEKNAEKFIDWIDKIYDTIYGDYSEFEDDDNISFEEYKKETIEFLKEDIEFSENKVEKDKIKKALETLSVINDEVKFEEKLNELYDWIDDFYLADDEDFDFNAEKAKILKYHKEEISQIKDEEFKKELTKLNSELEKIEDENEFFDKLDEIYSNEKIVKYYEENLPEWVEIVDFEDFDFDTEKKYILEELSNEINFLDTDELKNEAKKDLENLKTIDNEEDFFDKLDELYIKYDDNYNDDFSDDYYPEDDFDDFIMTGSTGIK